MQRVLLPLTTHLKQTHDLDASYLKWHFWSDTVYFMLHTWSAHLTPNITLMFHIVGDLKASLTSNLVTRFRHIHTKLTLNGFQTAHFFSAA